MSIARTMVLALFCGLAGTVTQAQVRDSVFADYASYSAFVDGKIVTRDWETLIKVMGGRDEYTAEQLANLDAQFDRIFPVDFRNSGIFRRTELGEGMTQEGRFYWTGDSYVYYYALLHQRADDLIVLEFAINTDAETIMNMF